MNIKIGNKSYSIPSVALSLMLLAILVPSVKYSINLNNPSAAELLVAISISLFSSVLFLWILDATSILTFRSPWVSKSIYSAAIVSVLGTSVGVYKDYFDSTKYQYSGKWEISILNKPDSTFILNNNIALTYSENSKQYWGYSNLIKNLSDSNVAAAAEVVQFDDKTYETTLKIIFLRKKEIVLPIVFEKNKKTNELVFNSEKYKITLQRPSY